MARRTSWRTWSWLAAALVMVALAQGGAAARQEPRRPQVTPPVRPTPPPPPDRPALVTADGKPLGLARVQIEATVHGLLARTRTTLTFRNDTSRTLEGTLSFPLPAGASVSGYALDIGGELVDAVPVPRDEARVVFEQEQRRGVDPGLVEWTRGNAFRTRVWPIPARGTRTVRVDVVSEVTFTGSAAEAATLYRLPVAYADAVPQVDVRVEVVRPEAPPAVRGDTLATLTFERWEDRYVASRTLRDARLTGELVVALPLTKAGNVVVERGDDGRAYFVVNDEPPAAPAMTASRPKRVAILWDASLSREQADHGRERAFVAAWLQRLGDVDVDVVAFRDQAEPVRAFHVAGGDAKAVLAHLDGLPLDGGTRLASIVVPPAASYAVLFSDGLATLDERAPAAFRVPVYAVASSPNADHALLRRLAEGSGGSLLELGAGHGEAALDALGLPAFSLQGVDVASGAVEELTPVLPRPVQGRVVLAGRLAAPEAQLVLRYGRPGQPAVSHTVTVRGSDAARGDLAPLHWAQQRVADLAVAPEENRRALEQLGRAFGIVTPGTSLLVLETLEQHLAHDIEPARTRTAMHAAWETRRAQRDKTAALTRKDKLEQVVRQWQERVAWWERDDRGEPAGDPRKSQRDGRPGETAAAAVPAEAEDVRALDGDAQRAVVGGVVGGRPEAPPAPAPMAGAAPRGTPAPSLPAATASAGFAGGGSEEAKKKEDKAAASGGGGSVIALRPWDPKTPYLASLREAGGPEKAYTAYLKERTTHGRSPAFFLDCSDELARQGARALAVRVLTSIVELQLDEPRLLRVTAHRLAQVGEHDLAVRLFEQVARLRPEEPQSPRDLALALAARADAAKSATRAADLDRAVTLLWDVVLGAWDGRFPEIEVIAVDELNHILVRAEREKLRLAARGRVDPRLVRMLDVDLRVVLTWDTDMTDMDLWVIEPTGERCYYGAPLSAIGGRMSRDFTGGYGPEVYALRRTRPGTYAVKANFYGTRSQQLVGATTVQATVISDFGRPTERREALTLRLADNRDTVDVGSVKVGAGTVQVTP